MKKTGSIQKLIVTFMLAAALIIPMHTPIANIVSGETVITTQAKAEAKAMISKKAAKKKLKKWLKKKRKWKKGMILAYDGMEGYDYLFQAYFDMGDHTATEGWYYVDCRTGKIKSMF